MLNGKIYLDDLEHDKHGCHCLTPGQINYLMGVSPARRMPIDKKTRERIHVAYRRRCARCGSAQRLEVHHRKAVVHGGTNELSNLVLLCHHCHWYHAGEFNEHIWPDLEKSFLKTEVGQGL